LKLIFEDWAKCETITSKEDIKTFLSTLGKPGNIYAILEDGNAFIQAAGNQKRGFGIQYKLASGELYTAKKLDFTKDQIIDAFQNYYAGNDAWKKKIQWEFDPFEADPDQDRPEGKFAKSIYAFLESEPRPKVKPVKASNRIFQKILLTLVGVCLIAGGLYLGITNAYRMIHYSQTEGVVQSFKVEPKTEGSPASFPENLGCPDHCYPLLNYTPIIQYDVGGIPYELVGSVSEDSQDKLHEKYTVVYNPHNPRRAEIYNWSTMYIFPMILICLGVLVLYLTFSKTWQNIKASPKFKGGICLCIGIIMSLCSAYTTVQNYRVYDAQTTGVVKGFYYYWQHSSRGVSSGWAYIPIIEYVVDGQAYQYSNTNSSLNPAYHIHEEIQVAYDPKNPATSVISQKLNDGMGILLSLGLCFMFVGGMAFARPGRFVDSIKFLSKPSVRSAIVIGLLLGILYSWVLWEENIELYRGALVICFWGVVRYSIFHHQSVKASKILGVLFCMLCSYVFWENNLEVYRATLWLLFGLSFLSLYFVTIQWKLKGEKSKKKKPEPRKKFLR
jgi:hypothetical protein